MNNYLAMNICEAIMPIKDDSVNVTIYGETINFDDIIGIQFQKNKMSVDTIDYEDIYDNIDDYEYPYNHVNRCDL